ncbi:hypothetical protein J1N10_15325 [Carboxylicivirga sp. A043]|uniref:hypothetical protein n=1 Tax=Carboxylicivirga litoralis TaxID=2816963 RepID=UPI0021CB37F7|nr:hypothetical protein [Carboxylicivirga sp. A043]MCU4157346.1 hypothetical protein [Carboxylicivirga sp. A043]
MNKHYVIYLILLIASTSCAQKKHERTNWQETAIEIDGSYDDWGLPLRFYDADTKLNYAVSNDAEYLYLAFRIADEDTWRQIMFGGLQVEIDPKGKKKYPYLLKYPVAGRPMNRNGKQGRMNASEMQGGDRPEPAQQEHGMMPKGNFEAQSVVSQIAISGYYNFEEETMLVVDSLLSIKIQTGEDPANGIWFYEVKIPFNTFLGLEALTKDDITKLAFKFTVGGEMEGGRGRPEGGGPQGDMAMRGGPGGMGGGMPPGGGMSGPGGGGPGGPGGPGGGPSQKSQSSAIELKLYLNLPE